MNAKKWGCLLLMVVCVTLLSACTPANYTSEHKKEITEQHKGDAEAWFLANLPDAKMTSAEAYATGNDLYAAIEGKYKRNNSTYSFLYDYYNGEMYLGQEFDSFTTELAKLASEYLGVDSANMKVLINSHTGRGIYTLLENDVKNQYYAEGAKATISCEGVLPAAVSGEEYAKKLFSGEDTLYEYSLRLYVTEIPAYDHTVFVENPNLMYLSYNRPIDWDYHGVYSATFYETFVNQKTICIKELDTNLYGGYSVEEKLTYDEETDSLSEATAFEDKVLYQRDGSILSIEIPQKTSLLLFARDGKYYDCFTNGNGEATENEMKKNDKNKSTYYSGEYDLFGAEIFLPASKYAGYDLQYNRVSADGKYSIKVK